MHFIREHYLILTTILLVYAVAFGLAIKILFENRNPAKTAAYLLLFFFLPLAGMVVYYFAGVNLRTKKRYRIKKYNDQVFFEAMKKKIYHRSGYVIEQHEPLMKDQTELVNLLLKDSLAELTDNNEVRLLINGEEKFAALLTALEAAKNHIHLEYYIVEDDAIANQIKDVLIRKSRQGVCVRFIYDDFGSKPIRKKYAAELKEAGVEIFPFYKTRFVNLANRINYRNHRKIVVIDGHTGFVGGINISDRYINGVDPNQEYWRDTHLKITGKAVQTLQLIFISDFNFCAEQEIDMSPPFFPTVHTTSNQLVQVAASGPDSEQATLMLAYFTAIVNATRKVYITSPYLIPNESILTALKQSALSGLDVRLLAPERGDSKFVNAATQSFFPELLQAGVRIFLYKKGFVHAKTMVVDDSLAIVGTANMDIRSFDLNFEVNAFVYDAGINAQLEAAFMNDLKDSTEIDYDEWAKRSWLTLIAESLARLVTPVL